MLQRLEDEQIVAEDDPVLEEVILAGSERRLVRLLWVLGQDARLPPWPVLFADPGPFELSLVIGHNARKP